LASTVFAKISAKLLGLLFDLLLQVRDDLLTGCSYGVPSVPNGVIRRNPAGNWTLIAELSAFQQAHPVAHPEPDDFEPDGTWYCMVAVGGDLYALEPNHGELDKITTAGVITRVIDISASQGTSCRRS
jgi:hypothetical protein